MPNAYFEFKQFTIHQDRTAMKVTTDACLFGAWVANEMKDEEKTRAIATVLDIGAGTGLLSLMVAQQYSGTIDAIELESDAVIQANENVVASPWKERIRIIEEDILRFAPAGRYDCIICNPPFYENELSSGESKKDLAHHSKELRMEELFHSIKRLLQPNGIFFLLLPFKRERELFEKMENLGLFTHKKVIVHQSVRHPPFRIMVMGSLVHDGTVHASELFIWNEHQQYTTEFVSLLKEYYLYL